VGENEFLMGNIYDKKLEEQIRQRFIHNRLQDKEDCLKCWARYFCGGGCHANAYHSNGNMAKPALVSCIMHRKRIEGAIYLEMTKKLSINKNIVEKEGIIKINVE
jgi:uncharacterized protein